MKPITFSSSVKYASWLEYLLILGELKDVPVCAGLGKCGRCKIKFLDKAPKPTLKEAELLTIEEINEGIRLACEHVPKKGEEAIPLFKKEKGLSLAQEVDLLGIDIGTTTLKWGGIRENKFVLLGKKINPQMGAGSEVISRLEFALKENNLFFLRELLLEDLQSIIGNHNKPMCITGNSVMVYLLLGKDVSSLSKSPFFLTYKGNTWEKILGKKAYIPPLLGPFVGADISSGLYFILEQDSEYPFLFCDFGTNGEMVLAKNEREIFCTSVAMGPALEGVGLSFGGVFSENSLSKLELLDLVKNKLPQANFRITGTGYLYLLSLLLNLDILDRKGHFQPGSNWKLNLNLQYKNNKLFLNKEVYLDGKDIEEILKVKAALNWGINFLLTKGGIAFKDIKSIYVSGALGSNLTADVLVNLGFFPLTWEEKIVFLDNSALKGALKLLAAKKSEEEIGKIFVSTRYFNLAEDITRREQFVDYMFFEFVN